MNLRYQTLEEAADEVLDTIEDCEEWMTLEDVAAEMDIDGDEDPEALKPLLRVLTFMAQRGMVQRISGSIGLTGSAGVPLYRV